MDVERFIFDMYKDDVIISKTFKREIKKKFGLDPKQAHDIFVKISNYQIKKYGKGLELQGGYCYIGRDEIEEARKHSNARRYAKRHRGE